jgi:hypothetical protein
MVSDDDKVGLGARAIVIGAVGCENDAPMDEVGMRCCSVYREAQRIQRKVVYADNEADDWWECPVVNNDSRLPAQLPIEVLAALRSIVRCGWVELGFNGTVAGYSFSSARFIRCRVNGAS